MKDTTPKTPEQIRKEKSEFLRKAATFSERMSDGSRNLYYYDKNVYDAMDAFADQEVARETEKLREENQRLKLNMHQSMNFLWTLLNEEQGLDERVADAYNTLFDALTDKTETLNTTL